MNNKQSTTRLYLGKKSLEQSISDNIRIIINTSPGECPFRPRFGLGVENLLDTSINNLDLAFEVATKITDYEKRITVKQVICKEITPGKKIVEINYQINKTNSLQTIKID